MVKLLQLLTLFITVVSVAQDGQIEAKKVDKKEDAPSYYMNDKKLGFTAKDSLFQMNLGFRVQSRASYIKGEDVDPIIDGEIRRLRLKLDGFVYNPKFGYKVELGFSALDMATLGVDNSGNVVLDGVFFYKATNRLTFAFGQTKLPGNNQRVISSGSLEFTDRTINNSRFNIDRDFGFFADYSIQHKDKFSYNLKGAATTGEGRNWTKTSDDGVSLTGKVELFPLGVFTKNGSLFEGDLSREKTPKLMVSGAFNQNNHEIRTQGQLGSLLYAPRTTKSYFIDTMLKYNGWSAMFSYMNRNAGDPITVDPSDSSKSKYVFIGRGVDTQLSYIFLSNYSIAARYSTQKVTSDISKFTPDVNEMGLCLTKYIMKHKFKVQTEFVHQDLNYNDGSDKGSWYARFQIEIGI